MKIVAAGLYKKPCVECAIVYIDNEGEATPAEILSKVNKNAKDAVVDVFVLTEDDFIVVNDMVRVINEATDEQLVGAGREAMWTLVRHILTNKAFRIVDPVRHIHINNATYI